MFEKSLVKHFISSVFNKNEKNSASSCSGNVFHMIKKIHIIFGKQKHQEKKKKLGKKLMHRIGIFTKKVIFLPKDVKRSNLT